MRLWVAEARVALGEPFGLWVAAFGLRGDVGGPDLEGAKIILLSKKKMLMTGAWMGGRPTGQIITRSNVGAYGVRIKKHVLKWFYWQAHAGIENAHRAAISHRQAHSDLLGLTKNKWRLCLDDVDGDYVEMQLTRGFFVKIDMADLPAVAQHTWRAVRCGTQWYARTGSALYMHHFLTSYPITDHIDGNGLDNRRSNLRSTTPSGNALHTHRVPGPSGYIGVYLSEGPTGRAWVAAWSVNGKRATHSYTVGRRTEEEAKELAVAARQRAEAVFGITHH